MDYKKEAIKLLKKYNFDIDELRDRDIDTVARSIEEDGIARTEMLIRIGIASNR